MKQTIKIKNRSDGVCAYTIPELGDARNIRREFAPKEVKEISVKELEALTFVGGGRELLENYLQILDEEGIAVANIDPEPEYYMNQQDIIELIKEGSLDKFLDTLDFAPAGVIDLIKNYAVELPCNDSLKREALKNKIGFDVETALKIKRESTEETVKDAATAGTKQRRVAASSPEAAPAKPRYNVIN